MATLGKRALIRLIRECAGDNASLGRLAQAMGQALARIQTVVKIRIETIDASTLPILHRDCRGTLTAIVEICGKNAQDFAPPGAAVAPETPAKTDPQTKEETN
jgi:hypothetical protein